jgi:DNA-nicking Smr family endonuclease
MSQEKKDLRKAKKREKSHSNIRFEIELNAEELMMQHLEQFKPDMKDAEPSTRAEKSLKSRSNTGVARDLDLHGLTLEESKERVRIVVNSLSQKGVVFSLKIITGKGTHSRYGDGVLSKEIHGFVMRTYGPWIVEIEESPDAVRLGGVPLRGHFHVVMKP